MNLEEFERKWIEYINKTPRLLSLLYDADLMPEQTMDCPLDKRRMYVIAIHYKALAEEPK